jgi:beta-N-acetylhexosaminidase
MIGIGSDRLTAEERDVLHHPLIGGVILFSRNYETPDQLAALTDEIHALRSPNLLVAVDQEGGRVQRFREGFTRLPPMHLLGRQFDLDPDSALRTAYSCGWILAAELRGAGVDFSFAPVVDLDWGLSEVIGDRAFHRNTTVVVRLASALARGMKDAGMAAVAKHFPGHGAVAADSHLVLPVDRRKFADIEEDMAPFGRLVEWGVPGIMAAHVVYPQVDDQPASFSRRWLTDILRGELNYRGAIFSDDLSMGGAEGIGDIPTRARVALDAGCDMVLICNDPDAVTETLDSLGGFSDPPGQLRLTRLHGRGEFRLAGLSDDERWIRARQTLSTCMETPALQLDA